jgi:preprotein translocase subunit YajC
MEQAAPQGDLLSAMIPLAVMFVIFYFLLIRPQQKKANEHKGMVESLEKGDKIVTNGGLIVEVVKAEDTFFKVKLNDDTIVKLSKEFVARKVDEDNEAKA